MEKKRPHYPLEEIQASVRREGRRAFTVTALRGGAEMGMSVAMMLEVVCTMPRGCFYKSMTTLYDHTIWQDVYVVPTSAGEAYVKVTGFDDGRPPVIQFKRR
ncbi:MAG: type II toxin-antitoxin system MqsR family toxin [Hyphomicrobiaceae bacterium]|nr:MAG: type II toxin-antitoxin system MqsR family toxin [Hyphomicrobiaceae bacterium]